jgi:type II secretory pathway pseudopilin PulG
MTKRRGVTLVEVLVGLCLGIIILGAVSFSTVRFIQNRELDAVSTTLVSYLRTAALRSLQSENNSSHGVTTAGGQLTLFSGTTYAGRDQTKDTIRPYASYINFSGLNEIVFGKQTGTPSGTGTYVVTNGIRSYSITVYSTGAISKQ